MKDFTKCRGNCSDPIIMGQLHFASAFKLATANLKIFTFVNAYMNVRLICSFFHNESAYTDENAYIVKFLTYEYDAHASAFIVKFRTSVTDNFIIFICEKFRNLCEFFHRLTFFPFVNFFTCLHFFICEIFHI